MEGFKKGVQTPLRAGEASLTLPKLDVYADHMRRSAYQQTDHLFVCRFFGYKKETKIYLSVIQYFDYSLDTHMHALRSSHASDAHQHIIGKLGDLPGADVPAVELLGSHGGEVRDRPVEVLLASARHER